MSGLVSVGEVSDMTLFEDGDQEMDESDEEEEENEDEEDKEEEETKGGEGGALVKAAKSAAKSAAASGRGKSVGKSLEALFEVGQCVKCVVLGTSTTKHGRKSVSLTLKPSAFNRGLFLEHLKPGSSVYGAVSSVEVICLLRKRRLF